MTVASISNWTLHLFPIFPLSPLKACEILENNWVQHELGSPPSKTLSEKRAAVTGGSLPILRISAPQSQVTVARVVAKGFRGTFDLSTVVRLYWAEFARKCFHTGPATHVLDDLDCRRRIFHSGVLHKRGCSQMRNPTIWIYRLLILSVVTQIFFTPPYQGLVIGW